MAVYVTGSFLPPNPNHPQFANSVRVGGVRNPIVAALLMGVVVLASAIDQSLDRETDVGGDPVPNPTPGQVNTDGAYITLGSWLLQHGVANDSDPRWPAGPDGSKVPSTHVWAADGVVMNGQNVWVWRPMPEIQPQ